MKSVLLGPGTILLMTAPSLAQGDVVAGEKVFKRCQARHAIGEGAANKSGPELNGIAGCPAASIGGFNYSTAMKTAGADGLIWTLEELHAFLQAPRDIVPGTKMAFGGVKKQEDLDNLTAYLATFSADRTAIRR